MKPQTFEEYKQIMGLSAVDIGSKTLLIKQIIKMAKEKGYKTAGFYRMPKKQLKAVYYKLKNN